MILDFIYLLILIIFFYKGYKRGFVYALFSFIAILIGVVGAIKLSDSISASLFDDSPKLAKWAPFITYVLVFFIIVWLIRICGSLIQKSLHIIALGLINRILGALVYGFLFSFVFSVFLWLFTSMGLLSVTTIQESRAYPILEPLALFFFDSLSAILPFFKKSWEQLNLFFEKVSYKLK